PDMVPALAAALQGDSKTGVRLEAAETLGKLRRIAAAAGQALEQAVANDASMRVRLQARRSLLNYRLHGYRSQGKPDAVAAVPGPGEKVEPPSPPPAAPKKGLSLPFGTRAKAPALPAETPPPPLAAPANPGVAPVP